MLAFKTYSFQTDSSQQSAWDMFSADTSTYGCSQSTSCSLSDFLQTNIEDDQNSAEVHEPKGESQHLHGAICHEPEATDAQPAERRLGDSFQPFLQTWLTTNLVHPGSARGNAVRVQRSARARFPRMIEAG